MLVRCVASPADACISMYCMCIAALQAELNSNDEILRSVNTALGHGQRAMPEDAFKPAELQASMHDSVASQAKGGAPVAADTIFMLHDTAFLCNPGHGTCEALLRTAQRAAAHIDAQKMHCCNARDKAMH